MENAIINFQIWLKSFIWLCTILVPLLKTGNGYEPVSYQTFTPGRPIRVADLPGLFIPTPPLVPQRAALNKQLTPIYEARNIEFAFPSREERQSALLSGQYNPDAAYPVDVEVFHPPYAQEPDVFMTIPRFGKGIPYSLARLTKVQAPNGTQIEAFPSYAWHSSHGKNCDGLTSVFRIQIDECGHMWIIDSGEISQMHLCQPQVVVLDLKTHDVVARYRLPERVFKRNLSRIVNMLVDIHDPPPTGQCKCAFVYLADTTANAIIVVNMITQESWTVENIFTQPDPNFLQHTIAGDSFQLNDGVFGLAVTPRHLGLRRMLYFHPLSADVQASVPLDVINNATNFLNGPNSSLEHFTELGRRGVHCAAPAMTPQGYLLCGYFEPIALTAWDIRKTYTAENLIILAENRETLQFIGGLAVKRNPKGKYDVWMVTTRGQKFFSGTINYNEINFRILKCGLDELLRGEPCQQ